MPRPILLVVADPPRHDDPEQVQEAKAVTAVAAWCDRLRGRGENVTFLPSGQLAEADGAA